MMNGSNFFGSGGCFGSGFYGGWHFMMAGVVLLVIIAIALIVWTKKKHSGTTDSNSLNTLKENFVKGLISEEEYLSKKNILTRK